MATARQDVFWPQSCQLKDMKFWERVVRFHGSNRPLFILFTEFIAFTGTMLTMVGLGFVRELLP
jgi:hypothetical protein